MFMFVLSWRCHLLFVFRQQLWERWEHHASFSSSHTHSPLFTSSFFLYPTYQPFFLTISLTLISISSQELVSCPSCHHHILTIIRITFIHIPFQLCSSLIVFHVGSRSKGHVIHSQRELNFPSSKSCWEKPLLTLLWYKSWSARDETWQMGRKTSRYGGWDICMWWEIWSRT